MLPYPCRGLLASGLAALAALCLLASVAAAAPDTPVSGRAGKTRRVFLPLAQRQAPPSGETGARYETVPVAPVPPECPVDARPAERHGDKNLALRGYSPTSAELALVDYGGPTDGAAPQIRGVFVDWRTPRLTSAHRVNDWDWSCGADGCPGGPLTEYPVTLLGMETNAGEMLSAPARGAVIQDNYTALVLYAEETRLTLKYTREDTACGGYMVHLENLLVDPKLLGLYRQANAAGRGRLPALRNGQPLGRAAGDEVLIAMRDAGAFMDPRSRKDWWQGQ